MEMLRNGTIVGVLFMLTIFGNLKADDDVASEVGRTINSMGISIFNQLATNMPQNNVFISPLAICVELNLMLLGAKGDTFNELSNGLGYTALGLNQNQVQNALQNLLKEVKADQGANEMSCINSIWIQAGSNVSPTYKSTVQNSFFAKEQQIDFTDSSATNTINTWMNQQSNGTISTIFDSNLDKATKLVLASGQYFKGHWNVSFDPKKTQEEPFYVNGGQTMGEVQMMQMDGNFSYISDIDTNSEFVEIPFDGNNLTMIIALPKEINGLLNQEKHFTPENVQRAIASMAVTQVHLRFPKFTLSYAGDLNDEVQKLGIQKVFVPGQADLSGIDGKQDLCLSNFTERVIIEVDETGTLPPSTFVIPKGTASTGYEYPKVVFFTADHPFGFLIRHVPTQTILFIGRVNAP